MPLRSQRKYIGELYNSKKVFLVYKIKKNTISSDGPFANIEQANILMKELLLDGTCAWIVSYNG